jgi:hypothetical protein
MIARIFAAAGFAAILCGPASAATQDKLATCGWSADEQKLTGHKRRAYMARCTADQDSPRGKPVAAPGQKPKAQ